MSQDNLLGKDLFIGDQDPAIRVKRVNFSEGAVKLLQNYSRVEALAMEVFVHRREDLNYNEDDCVNPKNGARISIRKDSPDLTDHDKVSLFLPGKNVGELEEITLFIPKVVDGEGKVKKGNRYVKPVHIARRFKSMGPIGQQKTINGERSSVSLGGINTEFVNGENENVTSEDNTALSPKWIATKICRAFSLDEGKELAIFDC